MRSRVIAAVIIGSKGDRYYVNLEKPWCTCPAFRFQKVPVGERTCKHLAAARRQAA